MRYIKCIDCGSIIVHTLGRRPARCKACRAIYIKRRWSDAGKEFYKNNKKLIRDYHRERYRNNSGYYERKERRAKMTIQEIRHKYYLTAKSKGYFEEYRRRRRRDPSFRISNNLRNRIWRLLKKDQSYKKYYHLEELVGCSLDFLKKHIESMFEKNMSWDNYGNGGWEIDHIIPCSYFDLSKREEQKKCFHYTNMQPLWRKDNRLKSNKIL